MSTNPPAGVVRFNGKPTLFYMAICKKCDIALPFGCPPNRSDWIRGHCQAIGHSPEDIDIALDVRPSPGSVPMMTRLPMRG